METLICENIDGHNVIVNIGIQYIDPMRSKNKTKAALEKSNEWLNWIDAIAKVKNIVPANKKDKVGMQRFGREMQAAISEGDIIKRSLVTKEKLLAKENIVYFPLPNGHELAEKTELKTIRRSLKQLPEDHVLLRDLSTLRDRRGEVYFLETNGDMLPHKIAKLGEAVPENAKPIKDLTTEDRRKINDTNRRIKIRKMNNEQRDAELKNELRRLSGRLSSDVTAAEVSGQDRPAALQFAQDEYKKLSKEIKTKYENI